MPNSTHTATLLVAAKVVAPCLNRLSAESKGKDTRNLDIHEDDQLDEAQLAAWVKQASQLPGWGKA